MLVAHMNSIEEHLLAISKIPANSGHTLHRGTPREAFIREFLDKHLNSTVSIGTGEIIDCNSKPRDKRNQFDIVIYKKNYPRMDFGGGVNAFLAESVVATIEVKSILDKAAIEQAVGAAVKAKQLVKSENKSFSAGYLPPSILSFVVAYEGPAKMETAHAWIKECYLARGLAEPVLPLEADRMRVASPALDGVFLLGGGFLNFDNAPYGFIPDQVRKDHPSIRWAIANTTRGSLMSFFMQLTVATSNIEGAWLNPLPYLSAFLVHDLQFGI
jgi:hypothetical protein